MNAFIRRSWTLIQIIYVVCQVWTCWAVGGQLNGQEDRFMADWTLQQDRSDHTDHCNHHYNIGGQEGGSYTGYWLIQVHAVVTPGQTADLYSQGQGHIDPDTCSLIHDQHSTHKALTFQETSNIYRMVQTERHSFKEFHPQFSDRCTIGHLSNSGFKQMISIGEHLYKSYLDQSYYSNLLPRSSHVHAESFTDQSSYHSVLALLHGLLPEKEFVKVKVHKTPDNFCDTSQSQLSSCRCDYLDQMMPYVLQYLGEGKYMFKNSIPFIDELRKLFGAYSDDGLSGLQLYKLLQHAKCNNQSSICVTPTNCHNITNVIETQLQNLTKQFQHQMFLDPIFRQYTETAVFPFLQRVMNTKKLDKQKDLNIYAGSGYFLELLRISLGIVKDVPLPPASRFVFEVYEKNPNQLDAGNQYLRVLLNGEDVTGNLIGCRDRMENGLCPISVFTQLTSSLGQLYTQTCEVNSVKPLLDQTAGISTS